MTCHSAVVAGPSRQIKTKRIQRKGFALESRPVRYRLNRIVYWQHTTELTVTLHNH